MKPLNCFFQLSASLLVFLGLAGSGFAQELLDSDLPRDPNGNTPADNAFRWMQHNATLGSSQSPLNNFRLSDTTGLDDSPLANRFDDPNLWCPPDEAEPWKPGKCVNANAKFLNEFKPGKKEIGYVTGFNPLNGVSEAMKWGPVTEMLGSDPLSSALGVLYTTASLTDPSVASGASTAAKLSAQYTEVAMQAEENFFRQAEAFPEARELIIQGYLACIRRRTGGRVDNPQIPSNAATSPAIPRHKAITDCIAEQQLPINWVANNNKGGPQDMFGFRDDPNHLKNNPQMMRDLGLIPAGTAADAQAYFLVPANHKKLFEIYLSDYIFNKARGESPIENPLDNQADTIVAFRKAFVQILGDIKFSTEGHAQVSVNQNLTSQGISMERVREEALPEKTYVGPEFYYRNLVRSRYNQIHALVRKFCYFQAKQLVTQDQFGNDTNSSGLSDSIYRPGASSDPNAGAAEGNFWNDKDQRNYLRLLSVRGYNFKPKTIESLFSIYKGQGNSVDPDDRTLLCEGLKTETGADSNLDVVLGLLGSPVVYDSAGLKDDCTGPNCLQNKVNKRVRMVFYLAQRIAFAQFLGTLQKIKAVVTRLTSGSYDTTIRRYAYNLIDEAAGSSDIDAAYQKTVAELNQFNFGAGTQ